MKEEKKENVNYFVTKFHFQSFGNIIVKFQLIFSLPTFSVSLFSLTLL